MKIYTSWIAVLRLLIFTGCLLPYTLTVRAQTSPAVTPASTTICSPSQGVSLSFSVSGASNVQWFRNGIEIPGANATTYTAYETTTGYYYAVFNAGCTTSTERCRATQSAMIAVANITASITPSGATTFCTGGSVTLNAPVVSGYTYQWLQEFDNNTNVLISGATRSSYVATTSGDYKVKISQGSCSKTSEVVIVTVGTLPQPTITFDRSVICIGQTASLSTQEVSGYSYQWVRVNSDNTETDISGAISSSYSTSTIGEYRVRVSKDGCSGTSDVCTISQGEPAKPTITGATTFKSSGILYAPDGFKAYLWSTGATTRSITVTSSGSYWVKVTNIFGCQSPASDALAVTVQHLSVSITKSGSAAYGQGVGVTLTANVSPAGTYQYVWRKDGVVISGETGSTYYALESGSYTVTASGNGYSAITSAAVSVGANNYNYVVTNTILKPGVTSQSQIDALPIANNGRNQVITYFDGLGRPLQVVGTQTSPTKRDVVQPVEYDPLGRQPKQHLPYAATSANDGRYKPSALSEQVAFYTHNNAGAVNDGNRATSGAPYAPTRFEASPFNRVLEQGAPGTPFQLGANTQTFVYRPTATTSALRFEFVPNTDPRNLGLLKVDGSYGIGELFLTDIKDENGNRTLEAKDKEGRVVFTKTHQGTASYGETYYVYDDFGYLRFVVPPEGMDELVTAMGTATTYQPASDFISRWCFRYHYDGRGRLVKKSTPGEGNTYLVYNKRDEVILTQQEWQRAAREWNFTKYDALGRVVLTGIYKHKTSLIDYAMQTLADGENTQHESRTSTNYSVQQGYTIDRAFPQLSTTANPDMESFQINAVNYYDDHDFNFDGVLGGGYQTAFTPTTEPVPYNYLKGQLTGKKVRHLPSAVFLETRYFYDAYGRVIQVQSENHLGTGGEGGDDISTIRYDFAGQVLETKYAHTKDVSTPTNPQPGLVTVHKRYEYDHQGRPLRAFQRINSEEDEKIVEVGSNELGQVKFKKLGGPISSTSFLQTVKYFYNIRGWLTGINNPTALAAGEVFGMKLFTYEGTVLTGTPTASTPVWQYNGNIAGQQWKTQGSAAVRQYLYFYDDLDRLTRADYHHNNGFTGESYATPQVTYSKNGNILSLHQNGKTATTNTFGAIDRLTYTYDNAGKSNRLVKVADATSGNATLAKDFRDGTNLTNDYGYDASGKLTSDANKGITSITYNYLNLPERIYFGTSRYLAYSYSADGAKLRKEVWENGTRTSWTDYAGAMVYEKGILQFMPTEEGRALSPQASGGTTWAYEYHLKDHLGNLRVAFREGAAATTQQVTFEPELTAEEAQMVSGLNQVQQLDGQEARTGRGVGRLSRQRGNLRQVIPVHQGDSLKVEAFARYHQPERTGPAVEVAPQLAGPAPSPEGRSRNRGLSLGLSLRPQSAQPASRPDASLWVRYYASDSTLVGQYSVGVDEQAEENWQDLQLNTQAPEEGYAVVEVVAPSQGEVFVDDLAATVGPTLIVQENHYSPWGLNLAGIEKQGTPDHKYQYIGGEKQEEFGLQWYDLSARQYDPQLGRFFAIDPLADLYSDYSPYHYGYNSPLRFTDPSGMGPEDWYRGADGSRLWLPGSAATVEHEGQTYTRTGTGYTAEYATHSVVYDQNNPIAVIDKGAWLSTDFNSTPIGSGAGSAGWGASTDLSSSVNVQRASEKVLSGQSLPRATGAIEQNNIVFDIAPMVGSIKVGTLATKAAIKAGVTAFGLGGRRLPQLLLQETDDIIGGAFKYSNGETVEFLANKFINGSRLEITDMLFYPKGVAGNELKNAFGPREMIQSLNALKEYAREKGFKQLRIQYKRAEHSSSANPGHILDEIFNL